MFDGLPLYLHGRGAAFRPARRHHMTPYRPLTCPKTTHGWGWGETNAQIRWNRWYPLTRTSRMSEDYCCWSISTGSWAMRRASEASLHMYTICSRHYWRSLMLSIRKSIHVIDQRITSVLHETISASGWSRTRTPRPTWYSSGTAWVVYSLQKLLSRCRFSLQIGP